MNNKAQGTIETECIEMIFTTTFARCHEVGPCPYGYRKAAKALGGVKNYGRDTETDIRSLIKVLDASEIRWLLNELRVFRIETGLETRAFRNIVMAAARVLMLNPSERMENWAGGDDWRDTIFVQVGIIARAHLEDARTVLIALFDAAAGGPLK
jgi:hypothetical protein